MVGIIFNGLSAVDYYRLYLPYKRLKENGFNVNFIKLNSIKLDEEFRDYSVLHFHANALMSEQFRYLLYKVKKSRNDLKLIMDIDDYWEIPEYNPAYKFHRVKEFVKEFRNFDAITTTTYLFKSELLKYNRDVIVLPNCIDNNIEQFKLIDNPSKRLRVGFIGGSSHLRDLMTINGFADKLQDELQNDLQLVIGGFDLRGSSVPELNIWTQYERLFTNDYKLYKTYKDWLLRYCEGDYPDLDMPYRRLWAKSIDEYATMYNEIDVLIAPLEDTKFNRCKSELKAIEAGTFNKVLLCSKVGIYKKFKDKCLYISDANSAADAIKRCMNERFRNSLSDKLSDYVADNYNIDDINEIRIKLYTKWN